MKFGHSWPDFGSHRGEWTPGFLVWIEHVRVPCQVVQPLGLFASGEGITAGVHREFKLKADGF